MADTLIKRVGGKYKLRNWIINGLPAHKVYCEPCAGSFSVGLSLPLCNGSKYRKILNDGDRHLVNFFNVVREKKSKLMEAVKYTPYSREEFLNSVEFIEGSTDLEKKDPIEWARNFLIYNRQSIFGKEDGSWCTSIKGENIALTWSSIHNDIDRVAKQLDGVFIEKSDCLICMEKWDSEHTTFYIDPPYVNVEKSFYNYNKEEETEGFDHIGLVDMARSIEGSCVISYYDSGFIRNLYEGFDFIEKSVIKHMQISKSKSKETELLIIKKNAYAKELENNMDCFN